MSNANKNDRPAQVPGDAESPPKGKEEDSAVKAGVKHTDKTEPVQSAQTDAGKSR